MTRDVGERFLEDAEQRQRDIAPDAVIGRRRFHVDAGFRVLAKLRGLPAQRGGKAEVIQDAGPEIGHDPARRRDGLLEQLVHLRLGRGDRRRCACQVLAEPVEIHFQRGQRGTQLVVDLARDPCLLLLPDRLQMP